ncbi:MAG: hypothetical protein M3552_07370 [Planctomycetota bacterium]|nr:hypothetical protein [Planctomycetota bacterium]
MTSGQCVVIIDGMPETAEVLQAVFEPRGHRVERVRDFAFGKDRPAKDSVLVLHDDGAADASRRSKYGQAPRVVIGSMTTRDLPPNEKHLSPIFQYAELIRAVEGLLNEQSSRSRKVA